MKKKVLITGASGYVGGLLTQHLHQKGYQVRCFVRNKAFLQSKFPSLSLEIVEGDILDKKAISQALEGIDCAFYLIHFLGAPIGSFEKLEEMAARNFAQAADETKLSKIIYLGGLAATSQNLSKHLKSRKKVGDILRSSQKAVIEFQASIILGVGSLSFELIFSGKVTYHDCSKMG